MNRTLILAVPFFLLSLSACSKTEDGSPAEEEPVVSLPEETRRKWVAGVADGQLSDSVNLFVDKAEVLAATADAYCMAPSRGHLESAQRAWVAASSGWYETQLFLFGPVDVDPVFPLFSFIDSLRLRGEDYRETVSATQETWTSSGEALDAEFFSDQRFQFVGLLALENQLYLSEGDEGGGGAGGAGMSIGEPFCPILMGLAGELESRADELKRGWFEEPIEGEKTFLTLLKEGNLPSGHDSMVQVMLSAAQYAEYLYKRKVASVAGQISGEGWAFLEVAVVSLRRLLEEEIDGCSLLGLLDDQGNASAVEDIINTLSKAAEAVVSQDQPGLETEFRALERHFKTDIPVALGIDVGLAFTDGD